MLECVSTKLFKNCMLQQLASRLHKQRLGYLSLEMNGIQPHSRKIAFNYNYKIFHNLKVITCSAKFSKMIDEVSSQSDNCKVYFTLYESIWLY